MGADYYAMAVIGCEITKDARRGVVRRPCDHEIQRGDTFCPKCGKSTTPREFVGLNPAINEDVTVITSVGGQLGLATTTDKRRIFAGIVCETGSIGDGDSAAMKCALHWAAIEATCKAVLEPLSLWDPSTFGLWAVGYCSY